MTRLARPPTLVLLGLVLFTAAVMLALRTEPIRATTPREKAARPEVRTPGASSDTVRDRRSSRAIVRSGPSDPTREEVRELSRELDAALRRGADPESEAVRTYEETIRVLLDEERPAAVRPSQ